MTSKKINQQHLTFAIVFGLLGFAINSYPIPFFANVQLVLGNTFYVISAVLFGPWYALITATIAATGLLLAWDSPHVYVIFCLEALFLGYCRKRDIYSLYGSAIYWVFIGSPIFYLYSRVFFDIPSEHVPFTVLKQGINGLIYVSIASLLILFVPRLWNFEGKVQDKKRRQFSAQLTYFMTLMVTVSLLISAIVFNYFYLSRQQDLLQSKLESNASYIGSATENYLNNHKQVIDNAAKQFNLMQSSTEQRQQYLNTLHQSYPGFITMLIANQDAHVINASPSSRFLNIKGDIQQISIKDRDYFIEAFYNRKLFISSVFLGRGLGNEAIIAISAPLFDKGIPTGIIEGSLDLNHISKVEDIAKEAREQSIILLDEQNQIVYASDELGLKPITQFQYNQGNKFYRTSLDLLNIHDIESITPEYFYAKKQLNNGWTLYVVEEFSPLLKLAESQMLNSFIMLLVSLLFSYLISTKISRLLNGPLDLVANHFSKMDAKQLQSLQLDESFPREVYNLYQRLSASKQQLLSHQMALEGIVSKRTKELESANKKLKDLVDKDTLTGLYNRRYAENRFNDVLDFCLRSEQAITVAVLDLDFFKTINDSYGHLAGDECLRQVAKLLKTHFKRDTDIIARYGGEEFILILPISNALKIEQHLNTFRKAIEANEIVMHETGKRFNVTASIGAITANASYSKDLDDWIRIADNNLYQAKDVGRNKVIINIIDDTTLFDENSPIEEKEVKQKLEQPE
ncbi:diguanylate cyclase [Shewanella sp. WXL01]|uniref:diguanylate cyclase n=1 Tax=Shewanella maritima TaxID=2520507 RepID=A0A411PN87_9GAMM|nr:diguanylate cyclase [Shewanella sp. WXL01]QBF84966.1 diguanylate cyclase [Shewanella maritima]